ncbi:MAG: site-specific integrase [Methanobrevibacter sp.]|nr:site-specific integrase [Methanobrevibacter sp.]
MGKDSVEVKEHSTGFTSLKDAREYACKLESDIRESLLHPNADKSSKVTFDECLTVYLNKKRLKKAELLRIKYLLPYFEGCKVTEIKDKWNRFCSLKQGLAVASLNRYATIVNSILNSAKDDLNITPQTIKLERVKNEVVFCLTDKTRSLLLNCYSEHAKPIFIVYAYQGLREQENLQLQWEDVDLKNKRLFIRISKNGEPRQIPMHNKVWWTLARHWIKSGKPTTGHVWLNKNKKPYTDTRNTGMGGSPIRKAHINAIARLKRDYSISIKMRCHDWRHDWASRMVMAGVDLITIQKIGGWKSLDMLKRYSALSAQHEIQAINKI